MPATPTVTAAYMIFRAAVVGLGNIGQEYDYSWPDNSRILTHASAFHYHAGFDLVGGVDPNDERRRRFEAKFSRPAFESVEKMRAAVSPEVVAVAVPTEMHSAVINDIVRIPIRAIICEKRWPSASRMRNRWCRQRAQRVL